MASKHKATAHSPLVSAGHIGAGNVWAIRRQDGADEPMAWRQPCSAAVQTAINLLILAAAWLACAPAWAASVSVVGLFKDMAIVRIDGGKPHTLRVGQTMQGVRLLAADSGSASFDVDGKRRTLAMGQSFAGGTTTGERQSVSLTADARGHFATGGSLNGYPVTFLVDTGATAIVIDAAEARRIGLDYKAGQATGVGTAAGVVPAWRVKFNTVKVGSITLNLVDGMVVEAGLRVPLLGMSFLNRMEMRRDGGTMTLTQRY
jgi:aspartyl protease family protein